MKIGIADSTFSRIDMYAFAEKVIKEKDDNIKIERYTVPGVKDLPVACNRLFKDYSCDIVIALGMPGPKPVDKQCAHEASIGITQCQLMNNKHILEVFVHMDETDDDKTLFKVAKNRTEKHVINALKLLKGKITLSEMAGTGERQGFENEGRITGVDDE